MNKTSEKTNRNNQIAKTMDAFLIVRLLLAHVVGDFLLQCKTMCAGKQELKTRKGWCFQFWHAFIYTMAVYVFVAQWTCWLLPLFIGVTHFLTDVGKAYFEMKQSVVKPMRDKSKEDKTPVINSKKLLLFWGDQLFHLVFLAIAYFGLLGKWQVTLPNINGLVVSIYALTYLLMLSPSAVFIRIFCSGFEASKDKKSLPLGGMYIGCLERIMIVSFIFGGWMEGIGYLLAAKSVFRFGELRNNKELMHTEYILLGTFLSFTIAVVVGLVAKWALTVLII